MKYIIYTDGGARGNPGPAAAGIVVQDEDHQVVHQDGICLGVLTNNQAEYRAVIHALEWVKSHGNLSATIDIEFYLDSDLLVNQLEGRYRIKSPQLKQLAMTVKMLELKIGVVPRYRHVPRELNQAADRLVNRALDQGCTI